jgi:SpoVK/Ycf46/Vps4 family AAA+-type ATPase
MAKMLDRCAFYYLPISEFEVLSNPRFVGFWLQESRRQHGKQKIAILEDAEELLLPRDEGSRAKVSNLLNIGDGFLGDHLKLQVIATTNVPMASLDPAVTRPGRLMGAREFPRLSRASALRLAEAKGIDLVPDQADYSLAEIYCRAPLAAKLQKARRLGFA